MDDETLKFEHMVNFIWAGREASEPRCATFDHIPTASLARQFRRRLYYLRDQTKGETKVRADKLAFALNGRIVTVELKPEFQVTLKTSTGEPNDTSSESIPSEGDRLDDPRRL